MSNQIITISEVLNLNKEQTEAVETFDKPLFVVAGAGTGKTRTLTAKIIQIIHTNRASEDEILALTFTNKAANEMKDRIGNVIPANLARLSWVSTFHSFGNKILRRHIHTLDNEISNEYIIIDDDDKKKIIKEVIDKLGYEEFNMTTSVLSDIIAAIKLGYTPITLQDKEVIKIYREYIKELRNQNLVDFDDLIIYTKELFQTNKDLLKYYRDKFKYILIDEFQDTDRNQYEILKLLGQGKKNIFVVGDPDQSIYSFRGARYANNFDYMKDFGAEIITLNTNYRSTNRILDTANRLIDKNTKHDFYQNKKLESNLGLGYEPIFKQFVSDFNEANYVADSINSLIKIDGYKPNQIAVLYRSSFLSRKIEDALLERGIPYTVYGGLSFYQRKEIKDMIAYLRVAIEENDFFFKRVINEPKRKIGNKTVEKIEDFANHYNVTCYEALKNMTTLSSGAKKGAQQFIEVIESLRKSLEDKETPLYELIDIIMDKSGYFNMLKEEPTKVDENRFENINELKQVFRREEKLKRGKTKKEQLKGMLEEFSLMTDQDKNVDYEDKVILSTYHQVKGLEFDAVFLIAMETGVFPQSPFSPDTDMEEERRIAYVGVTRAKKALYVTCVKERYVYGRVRNLQKSIFYEDMLPSVNALGISGLGRKITIESEDSIGTGDKVIHSVFGEGVVVSSDDGVLMIAFGEEYGIKFIKEGHPSLTKKQKKVKNPHIS